MSLIECPNCKQETTDRTSRCEYCGYPIKKHIEEEKELEKEEKIKTSKERYFCSRCKKQNEIGENYCVYCGSRITPYGSIGHLQVLGSSNKKSEPEPIANKEFHGIYRYTLLGEKQEVYCPRCNSQNCSHYKDQKVIPEKTKTTYSVNLNPLKPFTFANKKEKVVRKEKVITQDKIICNDCGKIFN